MKTRIVVLQMSQIIRTAIFVAIGLAIIITLIWLIMPNSNASSEGYSPAHGAVYTPGTYTAYIILHNQPISVSVSVSENEILAIELAEIGAIQEVFYPLFKPTMYNISRDVIRYQSTEIQTSAEIQFTTQILLDAINSALMQATTISNIY